MNQIHNSIWAGSFIAVFVLLGGHTQAQDFNDLPLKEYERQLNAILKTRLPAEKEYVHEVVELVGLKKIPRKVVDTSFKWVLNKRPWTNNRFIYFQRVLALQGKKLKLPVPPFDYSVYDERRRRP